MPAGPAAAGATVGEEVSTTLPEVAARVGTGRPVIVVGLDGRETNVDWRRRDDGSRPGYADIEKARETVGGRGVMKTFMPNDIHSIRNDFDTPSLSLHVYGRNLAQVDRSEFSPLAKTQLPCPKRPKKQASPMAAATAR